jgi:scyllo-inositol 2-dehydrogenase (NADP+)
MNTIVVGMGVQGEKRWHFAGGDAVAKVDPFKAGVDFQQVVDVPLDVYDAALLCVPDEPKIELIRYLLENGKHVLVEKPLMAEDDGDLETVAQLAASQNLVCYTAYNHRFEPHFVGMRDAVASGTLGDIYRVRMFYGNGTARDVRNSVWRDQGAGVLPDLGSHLLDTLLFIFGGIPDENNWEIWAHQRFENQAPDHVIVAAKPPSAAILIELEMSLVSWRNHFVGEISGSKGSLMVESLCKWGPSSFTHHERILPSGRPPTCTKTVVKDDPTWAAEYAHFKYLIQKKKQGNTENDIVINRVLKSLCSQVVAPPVSN